jgi:flagellar FliJ protein
MGDDRSVESPSFTFRLERVRTLRESAEAAAREELARELSHRVRGEALLRQATHAVSAARNAGRDTVVSGASGADLMAAQVWMERAERRRLDAVADLHRLEGEVARSRAALAAAAREREVVERLKRKKKADHDAESLRVAQIALDEIALTVHRRGTAA